jgi:hypothetical protein
MAIGTARGAVGGAVWGALSALADADGSANVSAARALGLGGAAMRDLADAVHGLCLLHGRHPGVIDHAAAHAVEPAAAAWLAEAVEGFAAERAYIVHLVAAVGPLPSTPGQSESESAIAAQRHALQMLAASERPGCAIGAAMALVMDWPMMRAVLDHAADRLGITPAALRLPLAQESATLLGALAVTPAFERAALFGAQQTLAQHRGLWALLEARAAARDRG